MGGARRLRHPLCAAVLATLALSMPAVAAPAIWRVSDGDSSIHLFGSVHLFPREIDWRTSQFDSLLASADKVVFEVVMDLEAYATITQVSLTQGRLPSDETLAAVIGQPNYDRLSAVASGAGLDMTTIDGLQPWMVMMTLMNATGPKALPGVELQIDGEIATDRKLSLETAAQQMAIFADAPREEQIANLMATIAGLETGSGQTALEPLIDAWWRGDTDGLLAAIDGQLTPSDLPAYDRLIRIRNENWIAPLKAMLAANENNLVVVGAAHLVGEIGVPALLEAQGYTVERVDAQALAGAPSVRPGALGRAPTRR